MIGLALAILFLGGALAVSILVTGRFLLIPDRIPSHRSTPAVPPARDDGLKILDEVTALSTQEKYELAWEKIEKLRALRPHDARTFQMEGVVLTARNDFASARMAFQRALTLNPSEKIHWFNVAEIEFMAGNYAEAAKLFQDVRARWPENEKVPFRLYLCAYALGDTAKSAGILETWGASSVQSPAWYSLMAGNAMAEGRKNEAHRLILAARLLHGTAMKDYEKSLRRVGLFPEP